ncbi:nucleotide exchange factor GrpE [Pseudohoeflea sp. DP4N28-3]|uniref:Protein GrpE n=2 Tax=Pseudohoeflea coraliihabitans TaxID=2860393 RepID=A0ABS6WNS0_9HYPH|nr:nucleotide exchange factor GrpE [Pseudohoeflea sp. DP4N28-3]MBW3097606.1 nucleotide exchange factor GrpE [Pseudohoeflea sp. DP4N28-3]
MTSDEQQDRRYEETEAEAAPAEEGDQPLADIEALQAENADLKDRYLRLAAEMENLRRRTSRDVADAKSYSVAGFAREMLQVADNLRRAIESVGDDATAEEGDLKTLFEGVELTERTMLAALEKHQVRKINPKGEKFDPHFHQAMFEVPNPEFPNNTVIEVVQPGFVIGERVLRPAMVGVAKGGPKEPAAEPGPPNPQAEKDA